MNPAKQAGFSLLEILVAFTILSLALGIIMRIFGGNSERVAVADEYTRATIIAESLLAGWGQAMPAKPGNLDGDEGEFRWRVEAIRLDEPPPFDGLVARDIQASAGKTEISNSLLPEAKRARQANQANAGPPPFVLFGIRASVSWGAEDEPRLVQLDTLRLGVNPDNASIGGAPVNPAQGFVQP